MPSPDSQAEVTQDEIEQTVRRAVRKELASLVGKIVWTLLSGFALLVGFQLLQFWVLEPSGSVGVTMLVAGLVIVCSSLYLLYLLYKRTPTDGR